MNLCGSFLRGITILILLSEIFFNFFEPFFLKSLFHVFHLLLFYLLLFFFLNFLKIFFLLFFLKSHLILAETRISLSDIGNEIFDGLYVCFLLAVPLFLVFFLHLSLHPSVVGVSCIPFLTPDEALVCGKIFPIGVKIQHFFFRGVWISKALKFSELFSDIFSEVVSLGFFSFDLFKDISVDSVECCGGVIVAFEAVGGEVTPNIESKTVLLKIFLAHLIFVHDDFLSVVVIPGPFIDIRQHIVSLIDLDKLMFGIFIWIFIRMEFEGHLSVALSWSWMYFFDLGEWCLPVDIKDLIIATFHFNYG